MRSTCCTIRPCCLRWGRFSDPGRLALTFKWYDPPCREAMGRGPPAEREVEGPRRQRHSPSVSGFAAATSPWLRHREDIFLSPQRLRAAVHLGVAAVRGARVDMRRDRIEIGRAHV